MIAQLKSMPVLFKAEYEKVISESDRAFVSCLPVIANIYGADGQRKVCASNGLSNHFLLLRVDFEHNIYIIRTFRGVIHNGSKKSNSIQAFPHSSSDFRNVLCEITDHWNISFI